MGKVTTGTLTPAYGRDYKGKAALVADLNAGKDFVLNTFNGGGYVGLSDLADGNWTARYGKNRKVTVVKVKDGVAV